MVLPPPVIQTKESYSSIWLAKYNDLQNSGTTTARLKRYLLVEVDEERASVPMASFCFMTGIMYVYPYDFVFLRPDFDSFSNAVIFTAIFIWCGSQTGNTLQV
jgi:hypothetical protein